MRVTIVFPGGSSPPRDGASTFLKAIAGLLQRKGHDLRLLLPSFLPPEEPPDQAFGVPSAHWIDIAPNSRTIPAGIRRKARALTTSVPAWIDAYAPPPVLAEVQRLAGDPDVVIGLGASSSPLIRALDAPSILLLLSLPLADVSWDGASRLDRLFVSRFQRRLGAWHDVIALATQTEADRFSALTGLPALWLPLPLLRSAPADARAVSDRGTQILFIGDWNHPLNRHGLDFFLARVMPDVWSRRPAIRLVVAGKGSDELALPAAAGPLHVWGRYGDLSEIAEGYTTVGVLPLLEPLGIRTRLFELLAAGMPVVATEQAVDGIAMGAGIVTAPPEGFAQALLELLDSPQRLRETADAALAGTGSTWPSDEECAARWGAAFAEARTHFGTKA